MRSQRIKLLLDDYSRFLTHVEYFEKTTTENTLLAFHNALPNVASQKRFLHIMGSFHKHSESGDPKIILPEFVTRRALSIFWSG